MQLPLFQNRLHTTPALQQTQVERRTRREAAALECDGSTSLSFFVSLEKKERGVKPAALQSRTPTS